MATHLEGLIQTKDEPVKWAIVWARRTIPEDTHALTTNPAILGPSGTVSFLATLACQP